MSKIMIAVEYYDEYHGKDDDDNHATMEIFESVSEAYEFARGVECISTFVADFNKKYIYKEAGVNGDWHYGDFMGLYGYKTSIEFIK